MSAVAFALSASGRPAILAQGSAHVPPLSVSMEGTRLVAHVSAGVKVDLGPLNKKARTSLSGRGDLEYFTLDEAGSLVGESTVPIRN